MWDAVVQDRQGLPFGPVAITAWQWLPWILTTASHNVYRRGPRHEIGGRAGLDAPVNVHSLQATALTATRERGTDIIELRDFAGYADPRTTAAIEVTCLRPEPPEPQ